MRAEERRTSGVDAESSVGSVEWRRVIGRSDGGTVREGRWRRFGRIARGASVEDVAISLEASLAGWFDYGVDRLTACGPCRGAPA